MAVVIGANAMLTPTVSESYATAGMTSPTGRCHTFDAAADGYVRSEGCCAVVLKRMDDAANDQDRVYATVKGVCVTQDGNSASLTAPNGRAQETLLQCTPMPASNPMGAASSPAQGAMLAPMLSIYTEPECQGGVMNL